MQLREPARREALRRLQDIMGLWLVQVGVFALFFAACARAQDSNSVSTAPFTASDRFQNYFQRTYSWQRMSFLAFDTAVDHLISKPEWGSGMAGYGIRYATGFGRRLVTNSTEFGMASILHEDIRFHASHQKGFLPRLKYASAHAFIALGPENKPEPAYARFAGIAGSALIEPAWRGTPLSASCLGRQIGFRLLDQVQNSVLTEFSPDLKKLGKKILGTHSQKINRMLN